MGAVQEECSSQDESTLLRAAFLFKPTQPTKQPTDKLTSNNKLGGNAHNLIDCKDQIIF